MTTGEKIAGLRKKSDLTLLNPVIYSGNYHSIGQYLGGIGDFYSTEDT